MTGKDMLIHLIKDGSCMGINCYIHHCPLERYGSTCAGGSGAFSTKKRAIAKFLEVYGEAELMELLL